MGEAYSWFDNKNITLLYALVRRTKSMSIGKEEPEFGQRTKVPSDDNNDDVNHIIINL